jgi:hypothetical protein
MFCAVHTKKNASVPAAFKRIHLTPHSGSFALETKKYRTAAQKTKKEQAANKAVRQRMSRENQ